MDLFECANLGFEYPLEVLFHIAKAQANGNFVIGWEPLDNCNVILFFCKFYKG